jgi:hypothetical protein
VAAHPATLEGHLVSFLDPGIETLVITERISQITVQGVLVEATVQADGLRLAKLVKTSNRDAVIQGKLLEMDKELKLQKEDLLHTKQEIKRLQQEMEEADEDLLDVLIVELKSKIASKKKHEQEIKRLESQELLRFDYQLQTSGSSKLLPPARITLVDILTKAVSWCPLEPSVPVGETTTEHDEVPLKDLSTRNEQTTASGTGLELSLSAGTNQFVITAKDKDGQPRSSGGDTFLVESKDAALKPVAVVDNKDGSYGVSYELADDIKGQPATLSLSISLRGYPIRDSPFAVPVFHGSEGKFVRKWGAPWGSKGSGQGQFNHPYSITVSGQEVYVTDVDNHRVQVFSKDGTFLRLWGENGNGQGQFNQPY